MFSYLLLLIRYYFLPLQDRKDERIYRGGEKIKDTDLFIKFAYLTA